MRKIVCKLFVLGIFIFICASCGNKSDGMSESVSLSYFDEYAADEAPAEMKGYGSGGGAGRGISGENESVIQFAPPETDEAIPVSKNTNEPTLLKKKIIKDGDIRIQTKNIENAKRGFDSLVKGLNAYYEKENLNKYDYRISYYLKIRVPAENFERMVSLIDEEKDEIESKNIRVRDVTEEYADITARLASKKDYLKQYTVLLSRANSIKDILEIKENIRNLQEEIESAEGRLRYLNDQITFSTLEVNLHQKLDYVYKSTPKDSFIERVKSSLSMGWTVIVETFYFLLSIWWLFIILIAAFFFIKRKMKKRKAKKSKKE